MRQRYFSPDNLTQSQQYTFTPESKPQKRLRSNGSVSTLITFPLSNTFEEFSDTIGHYKIDLKKQIGSGYSSKVYKGISLKDSQQVAVKILNIKKFSPSSLQMLQAEINILRRMNHPNIMKCYDVYKTSQKCYIITELCSSGDLQTYMTRKGIFSEKQAIQIITQVSEGVKHLLKNGIIHRDLKPANILQGKTHWKIADFGFAMESEYQVTTKHNVGTPLYMPPEALIKNLYSPQSDIFAVGIILYEMLVGVTPWECSSQKQLIRRLTTMPLKIPAKAKLNLSTKHLLQKLCSVSIGQRMSKQQFLSLNFNNFSSLDILNLTYSKKSIAHGPVSKKTIENSKKSQSKSKSKKKRLIRVTSKDTFNKSKQTQSTLKQNQQSSSSKLKPSTLKRIPYNSKTKNQYQIQALVSPTKNRKRSIDSTIISSRSPTQKSTSRKQVLTQTNIQYHPKNKNSQSTLSTSIYQHQGENNSKGNEGNKCKKVQKVDDKYIALNYRVLISQLDYCRFLYYMVRNLQYLTVQEKSRQKLSLLIFKHLTRIIKLLSDSKHNHFSLPQWQSFKKTVKYTSTLETIAEYAKRYEKEYLTYVKNTEISVVREINQKAGELSNLEPFSQGTLNKLMALILPIIKEANQSLSMMIPSQLVTMSKKLQTGVQALGAVVKYYRLIQMSVKQFENFVYFEENSELFFLKDFTESAANVPTYFALKDQIKLI